MADDWKKVSKDNWKYRRNTVFAALFWVAAMVMYILFRGNDTMLYRDVSVALIGAGVAIIGSYVFGAVWDDRSKRRDFRPEPPGEDDHA